MHQNQPEIPTVNGGGKPSQLTVANSSQDKVALVSIIKGIVSKKKAQRSGIKFGKTKVFVHLVEQGHKLRSTPTLIRKPGYAHDSALKRQDVKLAERSALQDAEKLADLVESMCERIIV